jgi:DNA primase
MDKASFVKNQLAGIPEATFDDKECKILCPFHDDGNPSLGVSLIAIPGKVAAGGSYCWSCQKGSGWNELAAKLNATRNLGLEFWDAKESAKTPENAFHSLSKDLQQLVKRQSIQYRKPVTEGPWEGTWRGLTGSFLRSVGTEIYWDREFEEYRLYLPIHDIQNRLIGHVLARGENSDIPNKKKYLNSYGFDADKYWYCLNYERAPKALVIVEGPYDTLRFRSCGIPAIGALGAGQISSTKVIQVLAKGCRNIVLVLDADEAGRKATSEFNRQFSEAGCNVVDLNLSQYLTNPEEKMDPGSCPDVVIEDLRRYLKTIP